MFCQTGSTASGITGCWPARRAKPTSRRSAPCSGRRNPRQHLRPALRSSRSPYANRALVAAAQCASSRSSAAGKNRCRAHHRASRLHDKSPVIRHGKPPAAIRRPGPKSVCLFTSSVARCGNDAKTHSFVCILSRVCERIRHHAHLQPHP